MIQIRSTPGCPLLEEALSRSSSPERHESPPHCHHVRRDSVVLAV
jgi:hypothetical protein